MSKKCVSICRKRPETNCHKTRRCIYTNGPKRQFCRISSKYKMDPPTCNITRRFNKKTAASHIQQFVRSKNDSKKIKEFQNKINGKRIARFMKQVNPSKRRAAYLNGVCSDSGVCIAFGKETATIKKHFEGFVKFDYLSKPAKRIGAVSNNGFVKLLTYENEKYIAHAILKSSVRKGADNLYYEYLVGKFINKVALRFPCFVETYGMFSYRNSEIYTKVKNHNETSVNEINNGLVEYPPDNNSYTLSSSCENSLYAALLIQHIKDAENLSDKCDKVYFVDNDLLYALFQIYMPLSTLANTFTHYDLHPENVLLYQPVKDSYIHYHYHMQDESIVSFYSSFIVKIIDYGRSFFNDTENHGISGSSKKIYEKICELTDCRPSCGQKVGYGWLENTNKSNAKDAYYISSQKHNNAHDLRLLNIIGKSKIDYFKKMSKIVEMYNPDLFELCNKVKYSMMYGTPEMTKSGLPKKIYSVMDACHALQDMIIRPSNQIKNAEYYSGKSKLGDMHVYEDGRPIRFLAFV